MPVVAAAPLILGLLIALVAALILFQVVQLWRPLIAGAFVEVPVIGGWIAQQVDNMMVWALVHAFSWATSAVGTMVGFFNRVHAVLVYLPQSGTQADEALFNAVWRVRWQAIPAASIAAAQYAYQLYESATGWAFELYGDAVQYAQALNGQALSYAQALFGQEVAYSQGLFGSAIAYAQSLFTSAVSYVTQSFTSAIAYAESIAAQDLAYAQLLYQQAIGYAAQIGAQDISYAQTVYSQAITYTDTQVGVLQGYAEQVAAQALSRALAYSEAVEGELQGYLENCGTPMCSNLSTFGQDLSGLQSLIDDGLILAFLAAAVDSPQTTADIVDSILTDPLESAGHALEQALGLVAA